MAKCSTVYHLFYSWIVQMLDHLFSAVMGLFRGSSLICDCGPMSHVLYFVFLFVAFVSFYANRNSQKCYWIKVFSIFYFFRLIFVSFVVLTGNTRWNFPQIDIQNLFEKYEKVQQWTLMKLMLVKSGAEPFVLFYLIWEIVLPMFTSCV